MLLSGVSPEPKNTASGCIDDTLSLLPSLLTLLHEYHCEALLRPSAVLAYITLNVFKFMWNRGGRGAVHAWLGPLGPRAAHTSPHALEAIEGAVCLSTWDVSDARNVICHLCLIVGASCPPAEEMDVFL